MKWERLKTRLLLCEVGEAQDKTFTLCSVRGSRQDFYFVKWERLKTRLLLCEVGEAQDQTFAL